MSDQSDISFPSVIEGQIGNSPVQTVKARDLHHCVKNGDHFATWIKDRVEKYDFVENQDFAIVSEVTETIKEGRVWRSPRTEYYISIDMAKELAMVENNDEGRRCRRHFIECERRLRQGGVIEASVIKSLVVDLTTLRGEVREQLGELREEKLAARRLANGAVSLLGMKYALQVAEDHGVPQKGRGKLVQRIARSLLRFCKERGWNYGEEFREDGVRRRRLFSVEGIQAWLREEGHAMIAAHLAGLPFVRIKKDQGVLKLVRPQPKGCA